MKIFVIILIVTMCASFTYAFAFQKSANSTFFPTTNDLVYAPPPITYSDLNLILDCTKNDVIFTIRRTDGSDIEASICEAVDKPHWPFAEEK